MMNLNTIDGGSVKERSPLNTKQTTDIYTIGLVLYAATLLLELPGALARYAILVSLFWFAGIFNRLVVAVLTIIQSFQQGASLGSSGTPSAPATPALTIGGGILGFFNYLLTVATTVAPIVVLLATVAPLVFSRITFLLPGGFFLRRFALGARVPTFRERQLVDTPSPPSPLLPSDLFPRRPFIMSLIKAPLRRKSLVRRSISHAASLVIHSLQQFLRTSLRTLPAGTVD